MPGPVAAASGDGARYHFQHGPIDLIISIEGADAAVASGYRSAWDRFQNVLDELVSELTRLRQPLDASANPFQGTVARRMADAAAEFPGHFLTPMAAVAGAVADEICGVIAATDTGRELTRISVNNGGDIAIHLTPGTEFAVGLVPVPDRPELLGKATIGHADPVRGIATSGRHGRSHSLGIADAVTVLAGTAATADAAATLIANAVDLPGHPSIERVPATDLDDASDLGDRLVTVAVGTLTAEESVLALAPGAAAAEKMIGSGTIAAAVICLADQVVTAGSPSGPVGRLGL